MKFRIFFLLVVFFVYSSSVFADENVPKPWSLCLTADVWVSFDYSLSMIEFEPQLGNTKKIIADGILNGNTGTRLGAIAFNEGTTVIQPLTENYDEAVRSMTAYRPTTTTVGTDIDGALIATDVHENNSVPNVFADRKILILVSDGEGFNDNAQILSTAEKMKADGWWIYTIFVSRHFYRTGIMESRESFEKKLNLMKKISGNPVDTGEYIDSISIVNLPEYFRKHFTCS